MPFDPKKFTKTKFEPRTESVPVPDLKEFFDKKEKPVWKVRGLTGTELGRANESAERNKNIAAVIEGLLAASARKKTDSMRKLLGIDDSTPPDIAKRIDMLVAGSIEPVCDLDLALKLCEAFPVEFFQITTKILELTGKGHMPGKPRPSGKTPE